MIPTPRIYALIVAAGTGTRAGGDVPKQYRLLAGKPILAYSAETLAHHPLIAGVQVVINPTHQAYYNPVREKITLLPATFGGDTRTDSVAAGLEALAPFAPDYILIHDAARPFLTTEIIDALIAKLTPDYAVIPAIPVVDTVRRYQNGAWEELDRTGILRIQTPQAFPFEKLRALYNPSPLRGEVRRGPEQDSGQGLITAPPQPSPSGGGSFFPASSPQSPIPNPQSLPYTDDAALWLAAGLPLTYASGAEELRKVTTADDIAWAEHKMGHHAARRRTAVGQGFDVHALIPAGESRIIRLGGIDIESAHKLHGHSDADVVLHAIVDALLGAIAEGDIGTHFPPTDEQWKGADSKMFVAEARRRVLAHGGTIEHLDVTIIGERPKIAPYRDALRESIANLLELPLNRVSVKATTTEKLGFTGREEGLAAQAVATVSLPVES